MFTIIDKRFNVQLSNSYIFTFSVHLMYIFSQKVTCALVLKVLMLLHVNAVINAWEKIQRISSLIMIGKEFISVKAGKPTAKPQMTYLSRINLMQTWIDILGNGWYLNCQKILKIRLFFKTYASFKKRKNHGLRQTQEPYSTCNGGLFEIHCKEFHFRCSWAPSSTYFTYN